MEIRKVMVPKEKLVTCAADESLLSAIEKMGNNNVSSVVIVDGDNATGIVTSRDVMKALSADKADAFDKKLEEIMSDELIVVKQNDQLNNTIQKMEKSKTHHLVVVDENNKLAGILSSFDIVREKSLDIAAHPWVRS